MRKRRFGSQGPDIGASDRAAAMVAGSAAAQRIRLGLTGLAAIFLLVMVAAAGIRPAQSPAPADSQGEPLAVLGVAPTTGPAAFNRAGEPQPTPPAAARPQRR